MVLRVTWVTSHYPNPADQVGGIFFRTQAQALARAGVDLSVAVTVPFVPPLVANTRQTWRAYSRAPIEMHDQGVDVSYRRFFALPGHARSGWSTGFMARAAASVARRRGSHMLHGHYSFPQGSAAVEAGSRLGLPAVITVHGDDVNTYPRSGPSALFRFTEAVRNAAAVVAVSRPLADEVRRLADVDAEVIPIGIDLRQFARIPRREARASLSLPTNAFIALFIGSLVEAKGISQLAQAFEALDVHEKLLVTVGDGPCSKLLKGSPMVRSVGWQPNEKVREFLSAADVLVLPSHREGMPTVLMEAGAIGTPVVASRVGGIPDLLADERGYLVESRSAPELTAAMSEVAANPMEARARAARLTEHVRSHYDADVNAVRLVRLYESVLSRTASAAKGIA